MLLLAANMDLPTPSTEGAIRIGARSPVVVTLEGVGVGIAYPLLQPVVVVAAATTSAHIHDSNNSRRIMTF